MNKKTSLSLLALALPLFCCPLLGDSLWRSENKLGLCADKRARQVGDIVTVLIVESATATHSATTTTNKTAAIASGPGTGWFNLVPGVGFTGSEKVAANGTTSQNGKLTANMAVTIKQILPNGNLMIEGAREVVINAEKQKIILSGTVRPEDIQADNTVTSTNITDAQIRYEGKGPVADKQKPGILLRILKWLF